MRQLVSTVHVADPDGRACVFGPGDELPDWAYTAIRNPKAWALTTGAAPAVAQNGPPAAEPTPLDLAVGVASPAANPAGEAPAVPPRTGPGSGTAEWAAYALAHGLDISTLTTRAQVIAALDVAGVPTVAQKG
jgi:hypothetical protein